MQNSTVFPAKVPDWLLNLEVSDELFAAAYEQLPDLHRAWIKTCLARHHAACDDPIESRTSIENFRQGFELRKHGEAVDWALILLDEDFSAAPRFMATLAPALLAGVKAVYVLRVFQNSQERTGKENGPGTACPQAILVAAELAGLAGQGQFFEVSLEQASNFLNMLGKQDAGQGQKLINKQGRLLMLGENFWGETLILDAARLGITVWSRGMMPVQVEENPITPDFKFADFYALHPDLELLREKKSESQTSINSSRILNAALLHTDFALNPGQEGVWFWPELDKNFFSKRHLSISTSIQPEETLDPS